MSSVESIVELAATHFYNDVQKVLSGCVSQIGTDLTVKLTTDATVKDHFAHLQTSLGIFADGMQQHIVEKVVKSATARCQEHLTGDLIRTKCIRACLKDCDVEIASEEDSRSIEDLASLIKNLKRNLNSREEDIISLKKDLAREKLHRKQDAQTRDEENIKQRKRKSKHKANNLPANRFCKNVMRDFQKEKIWSCAARSHGNQKSPAKFGEAIVARIHDGKIRLRDALEVPVESMSDFKQSFIDILEKCHEDFNHPVVQIGKDTVTLLDIAKEFNVFWAKKEAEMQAKSTETESDAGPSVKKSKDNQSGWEGKTPNQDQDRERHRSFSAAKQCSPSHDERANNPGSMQLMDLLRSDGESDIDDVDHDEFTKMIDLWTADSRNTKATGC